MIDPHARSRAFIHLSHLRRANPACEGTTAILAYISELQRELAKFAPTHLAEVWRENERLKARVAQLENEKP